MAEGNKMTGNANKYRSHPMLQIVLVIAIQLAMISLCSADSAAHVVLRVYQAHTAEVDNRVLGSYECHIYDNTPNKNDWHYVTLTANDNQTITWTNRAGHSWSLTPTDDINVLNVGPECPYYSDGYTTARIERSDDGSVTGIYGPYNELYNRENENTPTVTPELPKSLSDFCWLDSYGRGVGEIPGGCAPGHTRIGLLCYPDCPTGYSRFGFDCHTKCPPDFRDDGLFCRKTEYGRGVGYPWKFGDGLNDNGMFRRCEAAEGQGNCEKWGAVVYPKCKPGYNNIGCCICRPAVPKCSDYGLNSGIDLSCAKKIIIGSPSLGVCGDGKERDAGLCYPNCRQGFSGIGPVCWGGPPPGWSGCGMGAARSTSACVSATSNQVISCGKLALFVASLGTSSTAQAAEAPVEASKFQKLKQSWDAIQNLEEVKKAKDAYKVANAAKTTYTNIDNLMSKDVITEEDYIRMAATMSAILDPSGVSSVISAFTYPKCDKIISK